jgi:hypothetical protein
MSTRQAGHHRRILVSRLSRRVQVALTIFTQILIALFCLFPRGYRPGARAGAARVLHLHPQHPALLFHAAVDRGIGLDGDHGGSTTPSWPWRSRKLPSVGSRTSRPESLIVVASEVVI